MIEYDEQINFVKVKEDINKIQDLLSENISENEKEKKIKEYSKSFSENLKSIIDDIKRTKKEQDKEIESREEFMRNLKSLHQTSEIKELEAKETELINILKNEKLIQEKFHEFFNFLLDILTSIYSEDVSSSEKKNKLQYEINILTEDLKDKGILKRVSP